MNARLMLSIVSGLLDQSRCSISDDNYFLDDAWNPDNLPDRLSTMSLSAGSSLAKSRSPSDVARGQSWLFQEAQTML